MLTSQQINSARNIGTSTTASTAVAKLNTPAPASFSEAVAQTKSNTSSTPTVNKPAKESYIDNVSDAQVAGGKQIAAGFDQTTQAGKDMSSGKVGTAVYNALSGAGQEAMGGINTASAPISAAIKSIGDTDVSGLGNNKSGDTLGGNIMKNGIQPIADLISSNKSLQGVMTKYPGLEKDIPDILGVALAVLGGEKAPDVASAITDSTEVAASKASAASNAVNDAVETASNKTSQAVGNLKDRVMGTGKADDAVAAREQAAQAAVKNLQDMTDSVGDFKQDLGTSFRKGATNIENTNPDLRMQLTEDQLLALNKLKENKSFALPEYLKPTATPNSLGEIEQSGSLTPTQAQDLITQLNKSTYTEKASGLGVDQSKIGLTNEIKGMASDAFNQPSNGQWSKIYSDYAKGSTALEKISDIVNLDKNATPTDFNRNLKSILNLSGTPEGKIILQNAIEEFKNTSGIDLTQGKDVIGQILDKQEALEKAQKPSGFTQNAKYFGRRALGGAIGVGLLYPAIRAIQKAASGK